MSEEPNYTRTKIGLAALLLLIGAGVFIPGDSIPVAGQATGSTSRGGCGGGGDSSPDICRTNSDCGPDMACVQGDCVASPSPEPEPEPEPEPGCSSNADCGQGMVCVSGSCLNATTCSRANDCASSQICHDGECVSNTHSACYISMEDLAPTVQSQDPATELSFQWEESTTAVNSNRKQSLQQLYNEIYWFFRDRYGYGTISSPLRIRAFASEAEFSACMDFMGKSGHDKPFYSTSLDRVFVHQGQLANWGTARRILLHEGTHFIFNQEISGRAIIFNEGLADTFSYLALRSNANGTLGMISPNQGRENRLENLNSSGELYPLGTFFELSNAEWQANPTIAYAQSWGLVYFMLQSDPGLAQAIMENLKIHPSVRQSYRQVIELHYSGGSDPFGAFETDWLNWIDANHGSLQFSHD